MGPCDEHDPHDDANANDSTYYHDRSSDNDRSDDYNNFYVNLCPNNYNNAESLPSVTDTRVRSAAK
jgi:hypothetical protein